MKGGKDKGRILVVDDERSMREMLEIFLAREGYSVAACASGSEALRHLSHEDFDLVITDINMPGLSGFDLLREVREKDPGLPVLMITAYGSPDSAVQAMKKGATDYLTKPFRIEEVKTRIGGPLERRRLARENLSLQRMLAEGGVGVGVGGIVGKGPRIAEIVTLIARVGRSDSTVVITGESGTGKELVARAIHQVSRRAEKPFITVNCGALAEGLLESELFGHRKGSFTGAVADRKGLFEAAAGGTLFLDEITETSPGMQVKLLRALQEKEVAPVGDTRPVKVDVRVLAASNRDLPRAIREGRFREDLYYRLNVISMHVPPLRERREDIPLLVEHFLRTGGVRHGIAAPAISPAALEHLLRYPFPGNVRELENLVERGLALSQDGFLSEEVLPPEVRDAPRTMPGPEGAEDGMKLDRLLMRYERTLIEHALSRSGGNRTRAAELLGITFRSLRYRLKKMGMEEGTDDGGVEDRG
jgi:two-component system response regulator PilR (NtrC family)